MAAGKEIAPPSLFLPLSSAEDGIFYFENGNDKYKIVEYLGDISPCQVFKAKHIIKSELSNMSRDVQVVALKIAGDYGSSPDFKNLVKEAEDSSKFNSENESIRVRGRRNREDIRRDIIVAINGNGFYDKANYCLSIPYFKEGSLRYIINERIHDRKLSEECIAVVLRQILLGLGYLHQRGIAHKKLHAGNIFVDDNPVAIKLGYQGSTYFHKPEVNNWKRIWDTGISSDLYPASESKENFFWATRQFYEPTGQVVSPASDIWNLGLTALELAFGPLEMDRQIPFNENNVRVFLDRLCKNETELPTLSKIFVDNQELTKEGAAKIEEEGDPESTKGKRNAKKGKAKVKRDILRQQKFSSPFIKLVKRCLTVDPEQRPKARKLILHRFFREHKKADLQFFANVVLGKQASSPRK